MSGVPIDEVDQIRGIGPEGECCDSVELDLGEGAPTLTLFAIRRPMRLKKENFSKTGLKALTKVGDKGVGSAADAVTCI